MSNVNDLDFGKIKVNVGIDASTKCTGYSIFDQNKKLLKYGQFKPKTTLTTLEKIEYVATEVSKLLLDIESINKIEKIIIEDIFLGCFRGKNQVLGFANLARLSGAIIVVSIFATGREVEDIITLRGANVARPIAGLKGNCQKAHVQVWFLKMFTEIDTNVYEGLIEAIEAKKNIKDIDQKEYRKRMDMVSKLIEEETSISEDIADATLLGYGA